MKEFSYKTRQENINKLKNQHYDILIIGGGITGAGVARDAALRGLSVALVEANDYAYGTSSRSSKLIHGGIRYLENLEFHLVFEALNERTKLFNIAPHLVHPLRFMIPIFNNSRVTLGKMNLGMWVYDALSLFQAPEIHEKLNNNETIERMPIVKHQGLKGSIVYSDAYMDDDRLAHETLRSAHEAGAVCVNYVKADKSNFNEATGKVKSIQVYDKIGQEHFSISAQHVVSTVGPWTDLVGPTFVNDWKKILRPTKGIHLTLAKERLPLTSAVVMAAQESDRIVFAIPRHEMIIIGTTDTDYKDDPSLASVTPEDVQYLINITNEYFPGANITTQDIISSYVGVRPLVQDDSSSEGKTSREHTILSDKRGFTFVAGGKYTTYRLMSEQIVDKVLKSFSFEQRAHFKPCETNAPLNSYTTPDAYQEAVTTAQGDLQKKLAERYGLEYREILRKYDASEEQWCLEAYQAIYNTMCLNLTDFYSRRVPLFLAEKNHGIEFLENIADVFQRELRLSSEEVNLQIRDLQEYISRELKWKKSF
ncbi:MAG: glycerol-3-phosphate dehydrogenase/oxidase [Pseudobdellovibrio sp.]